MVDEVQAELVGFGYEHGLLADLEHQDNIGSELKMSNLVERELELAFFFRLVAVQLKLENGWADLVYTYFVGYFLRNAENRCEWNPE